MFISIGVVIGYNGTKLLHDIFFWVMLISMLIAYPLAIIKEVQQNQKEKENDISN